MEGWLKIFALGMCLALCSCKTPETFAADQAPEFVTITNSTPFYRIGPMQPRPDTMLPTDTRFKVLRKEMGYSFVQLEDNRTGYIANENMAAAPPRPPKPADEYATSGDNSPAGRRKRGNTGAVYRGEQLNDTPLPDPGPPPDLNIAPEEVPAPSPTPTPPAEKPKFRF